jgi:hypothetical protein
MMQVLQRRPALGKIQRKAQVGPGGARHVEIGPTGAALERKADDAATRIVRGERGVARGLGSAPAAGIHLGGSSGTSLPPGLRDRLELGFGANLGVVQIHTDAVAASAAQAEHAHAFAAGRDIYFGRGCYDPNSREGLHLLAHEVAHVLQQTAREGPNKRLKATVQESTGDVQREQVELKLGPGPGNDELRALAQKHWDRWRGASDLKRMIDHVAELVSWDTLEWVVDGRSAAGDALAEEATRGLDGKKPAPRSFLCDVLKRMKGDAAAANPPYWQAALAILDRDPIGLCTMVADLASDGQPATFSDYVLQKRNRLDWQEAGLKHPRLAHVFPSQYLRALRAYLIEPFAKLPPLWAWDPIDGKARSWNDQLGVILADIQQLRINECIFLSAFLVGLWWTKIREFVKNRERDADEQLKGALQVDHQDRKSMVARMLRTDLVASSAQVRGMGGTATAALFDSLATLCDEALARWQSAADLNDKLELFSNLSDDELLGAPGKKLLGGILADKPRAIAELGKTVVGEGTNLLATDPQGALPTPLEYTKRIERFLIALQGANGKGGAIGRIAATIRDAREQNRGKGKVADALLWAFLWVERLARELIGYEEKEFKEDEREFALNSSIDDRRAKHRLIIARRLAATARFAGWPTELLTLAESVIHPARGTRLIALADWTLDPKHSSTYLLDDFGPTKTIKMGASEAPFTTRDLFEIFELRYLRQVREQMGKVLASHDRPLLEHEKSLDIETPLRQAERDAPRPTRWMLPSYRWVFKPQDTPQLDDLLEHNPRLTAQVQKPAGGWLFLPQGVVSPETKPAPFVWVIPSLDAIVDVLREVPSIRALMAANPRAAGLKGWDWLAELSKADLRSALASLRKYLEDPSTGLKAESVRVSEIFRKIDTLYRRIQAQRCRELLKAWSDGRGNAGELNKPSDIRDLIVQTRLHLPGGDQDAQLAAFMLDLAPQLDAAYEGTWIEGFFPAMWEPVKIGIEYASKKESEKKLEAVLDPKWENLAQLKANRPRLEKLSARYQDKLDKVQLLFGFKSTDGKTLKSLVYSTSLKRGNEFDYEGVRYTLVKVHRPFLYHPAQSVKGGRGSILRDAADERDLPREGAPLVTVRVEPSDGGKRLGDVYSEKYRDQQLEPGETPVTRETDPDPDLFVVTDKHDAMMRELSYAVETGAMVSELESLAEGLEFFGQVIVTTMEVILPGGQVLGFAEVIANVLSAVKKHDLENIVERLRDDPLGLVTELGAHLADSLTPEGLWHLLFAGGSGSVFFSLLEKIKPKKSIKSQPTGKLGRLVAFVMNLGRRFMQAFRWLVHKFRGPIASLRAFIIERPWLSWAIRKGVDVLIRVGQWIEEHVDLIAGVADLVNDLRRMLADFVKHLASLVLPSEILPVRRIVGFITSFVIGKIGKLKLLRPILDKLGWTQKIADKLTELFKLDQTILNKPNELYQDLVLSKIKPIFQKARASLVDSICELLNAVGEKLSPPVKFSPPGEGEMGDPAPEKEPVIEEAESVTAEPTEEEFALSGSGGEPIAPVQRGELEQSFGHDFGHVRLHPGTGEAARATRALGADALTSGSHVYLRPGLLLGSARGAHVLRHEMAHVLQQTGQRPLGLRHDARPVAGRRRGEVRMDRFREDEADRLAARAPPAPPKALPTRLAVSGIEGVQPLMGEGVLQRIVTHLTTFREAREFKSPPPAGTLVPGLDQARTIWRNTLAFLDTKAVFSRYLEDFKAEVAGYLQNDKVQDGDINGIAQLAQRDLPKKQPTEDVTTYLDVPRFVRLLEGFVFAKTGVAIDIKGPRDEKKLDVTGLHVGYVHLAFVSGNHSLWKKVMQDEYLNEKLGSEKNLQAKIRSQLYAFGPQPFVWNMSKPGFRFAEGFVNQLHERFQYRRQQSGNAPPADLEPAEHYVKTDRPDGIGLRLGTHGDLTARRGQYRDSHHTTQFLLVEFFRNRNPTAKAFPGQPAAYATELGLKISSDLVDEVRPPSGKPFDLVGLDPKKSSRGDGMPAILISRETHRKGRLHINSDQEKVDEEADLGQAHRLLDRFAGKLPPAMAGAVKAPNEAKSLEEFVGFVKDPKHNSDARLKVAEGMKAVYNWMFEGVMQPALERALPTLEKAYYDQIVSAAHPPNPDGDLPDTYQLSPNALDHVARLSEENNKRVMSARGF